MLPGSVSLGYGPRKFRRIPANASGANGGLVIVSGLRRLLDGLYLVAGWLAGLSLIGIGGLMMALSLGREVGFNVRGGDEISAWLCASCAYLGLAYTFKTGDLVRVGLVIERVTGEERRYLEIAILSVAAVIAGYFAYFCLDLIWDSWRFRERAQGVISIPIWIPQLGLTVGAVIFFIAVVDELVRVIAGHKPCYEREPPKTVEETIERLTQTGI
jgi:TRAP-type C4-dicarboxylate transport system permease small subunit